MIIVRSEVVRGVLPTSEICHGKELCRREESCAAGEGNRVGEDLTRTADEAAQCQIRTTNSIPCAHKKVNDPNRRLRT